MAKRISKRALLTMEYINAAQYTNTRALSILLCDGITKERGWEGWPNVMIKKYLLKNGLIEPIKGEFKETHHTNERLYKLSDKAYKYLESEKVRRDAKKPKSDQHEQLIMDTIAAIFKAYHEEWIIQVKYKPIKTKGGNKRPDAIITLVNRKTGLKRTLILEAETGKREPGELQTKLENLNTADFKQPNINDRFARFLVVLSIEDFNKMWRPVQYQDDGQKTTEKAKIRKRKANIFKDYILPGNFFFMYHDKITDIYLKPQKACAFDIGDNPKHLLFN